MKTVSVVMCTYNGAPYLRQQLDTIINQTYPIHELIVQDDQSTDDTMAILVEYAARYPFMQIHRKQQRKGINDNFYSAMAYATGDYIALSDQDDIWHSNKLLTACMALREFPEEEPNLFSSNSNIVDSHGEFKKVLRDYDIRYRYGNVLYGACLQGCSMVFNKKAVELFSKHIPHFTYHDVWMLYICVYFGNFIYWRSPLFDYRIHSSNAIGLATIKKNSFWSRIKNVFFTERDEKKVESAIEFQREFEKSFTDCQKKIIADYISYPTCFQSKFHVLFGKQFKYHKSDKKAYRIFTQLIFNKL